MQQGSRFSFGTFVLGLVIGAIVVALSVYLIQKPPTKRVKGDCDDATTVTVTTATLPGDKEPHGANPERFVACGGHRIMWVVDGNDSNGPIQSFSIHFTDGTSFNDGHYPDYTWTSGQNPPTTGPAPDPCAGGGTCAPYYYHYTLKIVDGHQKTHTCEGAKGCTTDPRGIVMGP